MESPEAIPPKVNKLAIPLTNEEYQRIKGEFPKLQFNDEDQTFLTKKGTRQYARILNRFHSLTEAERVAGRAKWAEQRRDKWSVFFKHLETGARVSEAAKRAGMEYKTVRSRYRADPEFRERWDLAEAQAAEPVENALYDAAVNGNVPGALAWLGKRSPERWPNDKIQIETKNVYELDASDRIGNIISLMAQLQQRAELGAGPEVIDVEASEPE